MGLVVQDSADQDGFVILIRCDSIWSTKLVLAFKAFGFAPRVLNLECTELKPTVSSRLVERFEYLIRSDSLSFSDSLQLSDFSVTELLGTDANRITFDDNGVFYVTAHA